MSYTPVKLDKDIIIDRTYVSVPEPVVLNIPAKIQIQTSRIFFIENWNSFDTYEVSFSAGVWTVNQNVITYTSPNTFSDIFQGKILLSIKVTKAPEEGTVLFQDGTVYNESQIVSKAEKQLDGTLKVGDNKIDLEKVISSSPVPFSSLPIPSTIVFSSNTKLNSFNPSDIFGDLGSRKLQKTKDKNGNVVDYYLPSEFNKLPDDAPNLYNLKDGKFLGIPRNSNVTESEGDVFSGYRKKGEVGSSLAVIRNEAVRDKTFDFNFDLHLQELEAVLPEEVVSLCISSIEFQPVLRGLAEGHTYLWEQISGDQTTVTWLTPKNQKDVVIDFGGVKTDRIFRFWISKGTEYEKHYDVFMYGTPIDKISNAPQFGDPIGLQNNHLNIKTHDAKPILLSYDNIWFKQLRVQSLGDS
jgi:hypothetical protein